MIIIDLGVRAYEANTRSDTDLRHRTERSSHGMISRGTFVRALPFVGTSLLTVVHAEVAVPFGATFFQNVRIFDG